MIKLTEINKIYRTNEIETVALENVNLEVEKGEFLSIMGPSGCGKSTLLNIIGLLDAPTSGIIEIDGTRTDGMKDKELAAFRNKKLGFVFQSFHLINSLNVLDLSLIHICQVLAENLIITFIGGIFGLMFSIGVLLLTRDIFFPSGTEFNAEMLIRPETFLVTLLFIFLLNLLCAGIPAWRAGKYNIVKSLNNQE